MKKIIRLTENDLHSIIRNAVDKILREDGAGAVGGAAANGSGFMNGANNAQTSSNAQFDVPFGGKPLKQKHNLGKKNDDFFGDTTKRHNGKGGSISIPKKRA